MIIIAWILIALLVFGIIVLFHEFWHFFSAKFFWVKVEEFWLWIPPKIINLYNDKSWTKYSLNLLPIWWFVKLKWEEFNEDTIKDKNSLAWKPIFIQMIIVLAWVMMNFILAILIISTFFYIGISPIAINTVLETNTKIKLIPNLNDAVKIWLIKIDWLLLSPSAWSVAEKAWIKHNDVLIKINNKTVTSPQDMINVVKYSQYPIVFTIKRLTKIVNITILPKNWKIWSYVWYNLIEINKDFKYKYSLDQALKEWIKETYNQWLFTFELLKNLFKKLSSVKKTDREEALKYLWWPIALWNLFVNLVKENFDVSIIFIIWAIISINLWIFNLLPIPALDWWRFFIMLLNWIVIFIFWRRIIDYNVENLIHIIWFIILIWLSIFIAYQDIWRIITG